MIHKALNNYILIFDEPSIAQSVNINYRNLINENTSTIVEWQEILKLIPFKLEKEKQIVFNSETQSAIKLSFKLAKEIAEIIHEYLWLSKEEVENYQKTYEHSLETILASNILNGNLIFNLTEFKSMPCKEYEKIQLSLEYLSKRVKN